MRKVYRVYLEDDNVVATALRASDGKQALRGQVALLVAWVQAYD